MPSAPRTSASRGVSAVLLQASKRRPDVIYRFVHCYVYENASRCSIFAITRPLWHLARSFCEKSTIKSIGHLFPEKNSFRFQKRHVLRSFHVQARLVGMNVYARGVIRSVKIHFAELFCLSRSRSVQLVIFLGWCRFYSSVLHVYCSSGIHVKHRRQSSICTIGHITIAKKCIYRRKSRKTIKTTLNKIKKMTRFNRNN